MPESMAMLETADGTLPCYAYPAPGGQAAPAVIYFMDGMGIRPTLLDSARKLASFGYFVVVPNLYYRGGDYPPFDHATLQDNPEEQKRVMELVKLTTNDAVMNDLRAMLEFVQRDERARGERVACVGYCMGGPLALYAAGTFPERVAVAASIHGASQATDRPDSPHLLADKMRAAIYIAVAEHDPYIIPGENERIETALRAAGANYTLERYPGSHHGFALAGAHGFDARADDQHRECLLDLFRKHL
jgi:carboxymethylenebutenolidase